MAEALSDVQRRNLAIAKRVAEINERGGVEAVEAAFDDFFHPDFEWRPGLAGLGAEVYRGRDGYREFIAEMKTIATDSAVSVVEIRAVGETHILTLGRLHFVGKGSDLTLDSEYGVLYRIEDGRARSGRSFLSHADAEAEARRLERESPVG
ncbi:MAG: nuclear transport factor 2 family protein [Solirubrobacterales bacterium]